MMSEENLAEDHFSNGKIASLAGNQNETAATEFEKAISLGLPGEQEAFARILLGTEYSRIAVKKYSTEDQLFSSQEWHRAESEFARGLQLDNEGRYGQFSDRNGRALLRSFDLICELAGQARAKKNPQEGIGYFEAMLRHCDYLPTSPLLRALFHLGVLYHHAGDNQKAVECWQRVVEAEPVDYVDEDGTEASIRRAAQGNIDAVRSKSQSSESGCAVIVALLSVPLLLLLIAG